MKRISFVLVILIAFCFISTGIAKNNFGFNAGVVLPTGDLTDTQKTGFAFGAAGMFETGNPNIFIAGGLSYTTLSGKSETFSEEGEYFSYEMTIESEDATIFSIFLGPQIMTASGVYFLPAITGNFDEDWTRVGIDVGAGYLVPIGSGVNKLDVFAKFRMTNLIGKEEDEINVNLVQIGVGLVF